MKSYALPTPSHRHPSFRWDDGHNATPSKESHA
jgi:hypothetical protein